jgi:hypothetical protein
MTIKGSCLCGAVSYECEGAPKIAGNCHCRDCQKATGSAYVAAMFFPESAVTVHGELKFFEHIGGSGQTLQRGFCPNCGSPILSKVNIMPGLVGIRAGTLDDPSHYKPTADIYVSRAAPWDYLPPHALIFDEAPPRR